MNNGILIESYRDSLRSTCPDTARILEQSRLWVHPAVQKVTLHGSRGPAGCTRPDSDIDLSLVVRTGKPHGKDLPVLLREVLNTSLEQSECPVELDLAAVFDTRECGLVCLNATDYTHIDCTRKTTGCLGVYKIQKGFDGFVPPIVEIRKMFPHITIWES